MDDDYDEKFAHAIAEFADRVRRIMEFKEADRCLEICHMFEKASPKWADPLMLCIHEIIIKRMWDIMEGSHNKDHTSGVYVILYADGHIKIGKTKNFDERLKHLTYQATSNVEGHEFFPCGKASKVEATVHRFFADCRVKNEFFKADFGHACEVIRSLIMPNNEIKH